MRFTLLGALMQDPIGRLRSLLFDLRYGGWCGGRVASKFAASGAEETVSTAYDVIEAAFSPVEVRATDVLVDVGCGRGRVLNWWLSQGFGTRLVGIELDAEIAAWTQKRLRRYPSVEIIAGSALEKVPDDATILYLFNPFNDAVMRPFAAELERRFGHRGLTVVYVNAQHLSVFADSARWTISPYRTRGAQSALLRLLPSQPASQH